VKLSSPSAWVPESKPFIFTEFGSPAVINGPAQPNVFHDPKSAESAFPHGSNGNRDDQAQASYIEAYQSYWTPSHPDFVPTNNPISTTYNQPMVDVSNSQLWAWDARPYPAFPALSNLWSDAANWYTGHWLNGRLGGVRLADLIAELLSENGIENFDVRQVRGTMDGYIIGEVTSARAALEVLIELYDLSVYEDAETLYFRSSGRDEARDLSRAQLVQSGDQPTLQLSREQKSDVPTAVTLHHLDANIDFQASDTKSRLTDSAGLRTKTISTPIISSSDVLQSVLDTWLHDRWIGLETIRFSVSLEHSDLTVGDEVSFSAMTAQQRWRIVEIESGDALTMSAKAVELSGDVPVDASTERRAIEFDNRTNAPVVVFLDLPQTGSTRLGSGNLIAATSVPWSGDLAVLASPTSEGFAFQQRLENSAFIGRLKKDLAGTKATSRWDNATEIELLLFDGSLSSASDLLTLNGANALATKSRTGAWEILQFQSAELIGPKTWRLRRLLRGQAGTNAEALAGSESNAMAVLLNSAVKPLVNANDFLGLPMNWAIGPAAKPLNDVQFTRSTFAPGYRGLTPLSPVHLTAGQTETGDVSIKWKRRDRLAADDWSAIDIPMSEADETYQISLSVESVGAAPPIVINRSTSTPEEIISSTELREQFGEGEVDVFISVQQLSALVGAGTSTSITKKLNL